MQQLAISYEPLNASLAEPLLACNDRRRQRCGRRRRWCYSNQRCSRQGHGSGRAARRPDSSTLLALLLMGGRTLDCQHWLLLPPLLHLLLRQLLRLLEGGRLLRQLLGCHCLDLAVQSGGGTAGGPQAGLCLLPACMATQPSAAGHTVPTS